MWHALDVSMHILLDGVSRNQLFSAHIVSVSGCRVQALGKLVEQPDRSALGHNPLSPT